MIRKSFNILLFIILIGFAVAKMAKTIPYKFSGEDGNASVASLQNILKKYGVKEPQKIIDYLPYELGDCFGHHGLLKKLGEVCIKWKTSIACEYVSKTNKGNDISILKNIVTARATSVELPSPTTTIIHARLGDVIIRHNCHLQACKILGSLIYTYTLSDYDKMINQIPKSNSIEIVAFPFHIPNIVGVNVTSKFAESDLALIDAAYNRSLTYRHELLKYFQSKFTDVKTRDYYTPDEDFIYLCHAKSIVVGGGNYGTTVGRVVQAMGGKVIPIKSFG